MKKRTREEEEDPIQFIILSKDNYSIPCNVKILSMGGKNFAQGVDRVDYGLYFHPPLKGVSDHMLHIIHQDKLLLSTALYPKKPLETCYLMDRVYPVFETHQLAQDPDEKITYAAYVQLDNVSPNNRQEISVVIDMSLYYLPNAFPKRFKRLAYFPYDVDPAKYGLKVDPSKFPQRTPLWFKYRFEVTGSKAYKLMGFYIPSIQENPNWKYEEPEEFTEQSKANMRNGAHSEDYANMLLLLTTPSISLSLCGQCTPPPGSGVPVGYGASPDGIIVDSNTTWDTLDSDYTQHFPDKSLFDPSRGVLEIKSSKRKLSMEAYFYPQVYMEMISANTIWCDVVRYKRSSSYDSLTKQWVYTHVARVYRVLRHVPTERTLIQLIKRAYANRHLLQKIVAEPPYVQMRSYFKELAETASYREITLSSTDPTLGGYDVYKNACITIDPTFEITRVKRARSEENEELKRIDKRHKIIQEAPSPSVKDIVEQIQDYTSLLKQQLFQGE